MPDRKSSSPALAGLRRRRFLFALGTGGVATVAVALKPVSELIPEPLPETPQASQGYRDTQHVRDYYRTTKI